MDVQKKALEALKAINDMCEVLEKAARPTQSPYWAGVPASSDVPDFSPEQVASARGSEMPISEPEAPAAPQMTAPEMPQLPEGVGANLEQYTPERLHAIVQHASKAIANALLESLAHHQKGGQWKGDSDTSLM